MDDEKDLADYLADELRMEGYQTASVYDGVEAVITAIESDWDALLMDIRMPNLDGISALKIIRRVKPKLPIIMLTGQARQSETIASLHLGAYACLFKPIKTDQLLKTLNDLLNQKPA
ncbi:MAG: response regulator [Anaerolineae bacterium]|nr:response regulator [Anaerolineae bacterium]